MRPKLKRRLCEFDGCNNEFEPVMGRQIYCSSERCREERERQRHRDRRARISKAKTANKNDDRCGRETTWPDKEKK